MLYLNDEQCDILFKELKLDEGYRLKVYKDSKGIKTVGVGFNIQAHDTLPIIGRKLTRVGEKINDSECLKLFKYSLESVALEPLDLHLPVLTKQLDQVRLRALINLCFNMGWGTLSQFKQTLSHLQAKNYSMVRECLKNSLWYKQVASRGDRIVYMMECGKPHPYYERSN